MLSAPSRPRADSRDTCISDLTLAAAGDSCGAHHFSAGIWALRVAKRTGIASFGKSVSLCCSFKDK